MPTHLDYIYVVDHADDLSALEVKLNDLAGEGFEPLTVFPVTLAASQSTRIAIIAFRLLSLEVS